MLYLVTLLLFAFAAMAASGLAYAGRAWRYAMGITTLGAVALAAWSADFLQWTVRYFTGEIDFGWALAITGLPFAGVLLHLWMRRKNTPRHVPSPDDDPVYRRFREEKIRRRRLQRQQEEMLEASDGT